MLVALDRAVFTAQLCLRLLIVPKEMQGEEQRSVLGGVNLPRISGDSSAHLEIEWPPAPLFYQPSHAHCWCLATLLHGSAANAANEATVQAP